MKPKDCITLGTALRFVRMARQTLDPLLSENPELIVMDLKLVGVEVLLEDAHTAALEGK